MTDAFDPYYKWLAIHPDEQPPDHYRLLGLLLFESDREVIRNAADQRMVYLKTFATGKHSALSQKLLNEVAAAKVCLLDPQKKRAYDDQQWSDVVVDDLPGGAASDAGVLQADTGEEPLPGRVVAQPTTPARDTAGQQIDAPVFPALKTDAPAKRREAKKKLSTKHSLAIAGAVAGILAVYLAWALIRRFVEVPIDDPPGNLKPGLMGMFFKGRELDAEQFIKSEVCENVDFYSEGAPFEGVPHDDFSIRYEGYLIPPKAGSYTFIVQSDDGVRFWLDGKLLLDRWHRQMPSPHEIAPVQLTNAPHLVKIEYFESDGGAQLHILWKHAGIVDKEPVPPTAFFHKVPQGSVAPSNDAADEDGAKDTGPKSIAEPEINAVTARLPDQDKDQIGRPEDYLPPGARIYTDLKDALVTFVREKKPVYGLDNRNRKMPSLSRGIALLTTLRVLDFSGNNLEELPPWIFSLTELRYLNLADNKLTSLPTRIRDLNNLEVLDVSDNQLTEISGDFGMLKALVKLDVSGNQMASMPTQVSWLTELRELDFGDNQVGEFPSWIGSMSNLEVLNLEGNQLTEIHKNIGAPNLKKLIVRGNQITLIPDQIAYAKKLTVFDLRNNKLTTLPKRFDMLKNLTRLELAGNPLPQEEIDRVKKVLPNTEILFDDAE